MLENSGCLVFVVPKRNNKSQTIENKFIAIRFFLFQSQLSFHQSRYIIALLRK